MKRQDAWILIYAGVVSLRFHPRNDAHQKTLGEQHPSFTQLIIKQECEYAARVADEALAKYEERFKCSQD